MQPYEAIMIPKNEMGSEINHIEPIFYKKVEKRGKQQKSGDMTRRRNLLKKKYTGSRYNDLSSKNTVLF